MVAFEKTDTTLEIDVGTFMVISQREAALNHSPHLSYVCNVYQKKIYLYVLPLLMPDMSIYP
jgi:hypothetical protein